MLGDFITLPHLLILIPLLGGVVSFFLKSDRAAKNWSVAASLFTLAVSVCSLLYSKNAALNGLTFGYEWLKYIGASFAVALDGTSRLLTLLTAVSFPLIFIATYRNSYRNAPVFYGLMLLTQCGLMGVFVATDALLFYFFWELALIPVYFLSSRWGGERRIAATFKFFVYTFAGSLLMLVGILYVYLHTAPASYADHSFAMAYFHGALLSPAEQNWLFWLFFIAFAIKMPIFPFHTWQPDAYEQSPTAVTMVLSGVMVKMGLFGLIRWLLPMFPQAVMKFDNVVIGLSVVGIVYASLLAIRQDDLKRLIAYSSIAHIGLMCASLFTLKTVAAEGMMLQMFNHGINVIGLWIVADYIEQHLGVRSISQLGGLAHRAPRLTILLVVTALANVALPLTNAFVGEFMMFTGLFSFSIWYTVVAGLGIILSAVYTLNMIQKVFYGEANTLTSGIRDLPAGPVVALSVVVVLIFVAGVYPQPLIDLTKESVTALLHNFR